MASVFRQTLEKATIALRESNDRVPNGNPKGKEKKPVKFP